MPWHYALQCHFIAAQPTSPTHRCHRVVYIYILYYTRSFCRRSFVRSAVLYCTCCSTSAGTTSASDRDQRKFDKPRPQKRAKTAGASVWTYILQSPSFRMLDSLKGIMCFTKNEAKVVTAVKDIAKHAPRILLCKKQTRPTQNNSRWLCRAAAAAAAAAASNLLEDSLKKDGGCREESIVVVTCVAREERRARSRETNNNPPCPLHHHHPHHHHRLRRNFSIVSI